jgi:hypothetical protein
VVKLQSFRVGLAIVTALVLAGGVLLAQGMLNSGPPDDGLARGPKATKTATVTPAPKPTEADEDAAGADDNPEAEEQAEEAEEHAEHFAQAVRDGRAGVAQPIALAAAAGWAGEQLISATADDWEPAVAADPKVYADGKSYAYLLTTRYASTKPCPGNCPTPYIALYTSTNAGASWSAGVPLCACKGSGQFDPIIEVVPNTGAVYALYMNGYNVMFIKSTDHGATWGAPVKTYGSVSWNDKPILAVSDNGNDVYVMFNGPTGGDPWLAQSHNAGSTWTQTKVVDSNRYIFAFDGDVDSNGTAYFAMTSILYGGGGNKGTTPTGAIEEHVYVITNNGATFTDRLAGSVQPGIACVAAGCPPDYYLGHSSITAYAPGKLTLLYDGATTTGGRQTITAKTSTDSGATWSAGTTLSVVGEEATDSAVEAASATDIRAWYQQTSGGGNVDAWNVWYRTSTDGGLNWTAPVKISDATSGASYKTAAGFAEIYGDYGEIAITSTGKTIATWGEGASYDGPGGVWYNRQTP